MSEQPDSSDSNISVEVAGDSQGDITIAGRDINILQAPDSLSKGIILAILGALLGAVFPLVLGYLIARPGLALRLSAAVIAIGFIGGVGYAVFKREIIWGLVSVAAAAAYAGIILWSPWCTLHQIQIEVESKFTGEPLHVVDQQVISTNEELCLTASEFGQPVKANNLVCSWRYTGDGRVVDTVNCSLLLQSGSDQVEDTVVVEVSKSGCWREINTRGIKPIFISHSAEQEER